MNKERVLQKEVLGHPKYPGHNDVAPMKRIFVFILMIVILTVIASPVVKAAEETDTLVLGRVMPLLIKEQVPHDHEEEDTDFFHSLSGETIPLKLGEVKKEEKLTKIDSVEDIVSELKNTLSSERTMPIDVLSVTGISSYFSRFHPGIDFRAPVGTIVETILPGVVAEVGYEARGYGRYVVLVHKNEKKVYTTLYAHLKKVNVKVGDIITGNTSLGEVGLTGRTTGAHLHFEIHEGTKAVDPLTFLRNEKFVASILK